jgi:Protein kinase domain
MEDIMEEFMNKLLVSPNLLEDEKLNFKIEKIFENKVFQKMVEKANVMEDAGMASTDSQDRSDDYFDGKNMLDMKAIEKSEVMIPCDPPQDDQFDTSALAREQATKARKEREQAKKKNKKPKIEDSDLSEMNSTENRAKEESERFGKQVKRDIGDLSDINGSHESDDRQNESEFLQQSESIVDLIDNDEGEDQYENDDDQGFHLYEVGEEEFDLISKHLAKENNFPERAIKPSKKKKRKDHKMTEDQIEAQANKKNGYIYLPEALKHPKNNDSFYPVAHEKMIFDCFDLKVIYDRERTGFQETKDFPIVIGAIIAGRYQIMEYLGSAAFSKAIQCLDLRTGNHYCMKIIENNKDYFDQSIDEIKLLRFINCNGNPDDMNILRIYDYFYHNEHLFIVTELLKDNLYDYYKFNKEKETEEYFTVGRLQKITWQILKGLEYIHNLKLIHCDLKPENILIKSYSRTEVKIIDFGSSCYIHDHLSSYVQSRSYRAPEVIIGCKYDYKIDMWSLGCILSELFTGSVLFQNETVQGLLSRVIGIVGPFPEWMLEEGKLVNKFFTKEKLLYQDVNKCLI